MSNENGNNSNAGNGHLNQPDRPESWDPRMKEAAADFIAFLKDPENKKVLQDFIMRTFKESEAESVSRFQKKLDPLSSDGNISPLLAETMNMADAEKPFVRGMKVTKNNLVRLLEDRVEDINRLLSGLGGFCSQLKSCFARSTVVFLEEEDPVHSFRERLVFSINLPQYELKNPWQNTGATQGQRTPFQATWDDAVNTLASIIAETGLKPKYCKNDRNFGRFVMKQDLRSSSTLPDEYFSFTLDYNTRERIEEMKKPYNDIFNEYDRKISRLEKKLARYPETSVSTRFAELKRRHLDLVRERDFFVGTTPDPNQLVEGLLFLIEVSTLKDYHVVKDRMQMIMTKYILHLSTLAMADAERSSELRDQLESLQRREHSADAEPDVNAFGSVPQYLVNSNQLTPMGDGKKIKSNRKAA